MAVLKPSGFALESDGTHNGGFRVFGVPSVCLGLALLTPSASGAVTLADNEQFEGSGT